MRARLFWKLGLTYLALLLAALLAVDFYSSRVLRRDYIRSASDNSPFSRVSPKHTRRVWMTRRNFTPGPTGWRKSGARVTVIDSAAGCWRIRARSRNDGESFEPAGNLSRLCAPGEGQSVRHSTTLDRDLVYRAVRYQPPPAPPVVIRMALPLAQVDASLAELRRRLSRRLARDPARGRRGDVCFQSGCSPRASSG